MATCATITATMSSNQHGKHASTASFHLPTHRQRPSSEWSSSVIDSPPLADSSGFASAASSATSYSFMSTAQDAEDHQDRQRALSGKQSFYNSTRETPVSPPPSVPLPAIPGSSNGPIPIPKASAGPNSGYRFPTNSSTSMSPPFSSYRRPSVASTSGTVSPTRENSPHPYSAYSPPTSSYRKDSAISQYSGPPKTRPPSVPAQFQAQTGRFDGSLTVESRLVVAD